MIINIEDKCGLPVSLNAETCEYILGEQLNETGYRTRKVNDLAGVWANPVEKNDTVAYRYTAGLWLPEDEKIWKEANIIYGIVSFMPGTHGGEFVKSSGQYHPIVPPNKSASPEVYSVLHGTGHFMLQKAAPPYHKIEDAVLVIVKAGETFVVPPDYGHLQINPGKEPLIFSYVVMDGMSGVYDPFKEKQGAIYYEMDTEKESERYVFNSNYADELPLRIIEAGDICQLPWLNENVNYHSVKQNIEKLEFITVTDKFPEYANL
jgi:glucose-6-phosphate isomerase